MRRIISNITWDATPEEIESNELPSEIGTDFGGREILDEEDIENYLSDTYGFCVLSFVEKN